MQVKAETDSDDVTEHHDDKSRPYLCTVCHKRFTRKWYLNIHKQQRHAGGQMHSCSQCQKSLPLGIT